MNPNDVWTNGKRTTKSGHSMSPSTVMMRLQKFEFHRSQIRLCARNRCKRGSYKNTKHNKRNGWMECRRAGERKMAAEDENGLVLFIIFCYCVHLLWSNFLCSVVVRFLSMYRKSKFGSLVSVFFFFFSFISFLIWKAFLLSYAPTHRALLFIKGKSPFLSVYSRAWNQPILCWKSVVGIWFR